MNSVSRGRVTMPAEARSGGRGRGPRPAWGGRSHRTAANRLSSAHTRRIMHAFINNLKRRCSHRLRTAQISRETEVELKVTACASPLTALWTFMPASMKS